MSKDFWGVLIAVGVIGMFFFFWLAYNTGTLSSTIAFFLSVGLWSHTEDAYDDFYY